MTDHTGPVPGHLGLSIGNTRSVAVHRASPAADATIDVLPTTLRFDDEGNAHLGEPAVAHPGGTAPFARFVDLVGAQEHLEPDAHAYRAEDLMANAANCIVTMIADGGPRPVTTMTYPTRWPRENVALLRDALDHTGLADVAIVPDARAITAFAENASTVDTDGAPTTIVDIGATGTDVSTFPGGGTVRTDTISGDVLTDALFGHVVADSTRIDTTEIDLADHEVRAALGAVVESCERAKATLSEHDSASIVVDLPGGSHTETVTRAQFARLIEPRLTEAAELLEPATGVVVFTGASAALEPVTSALTARTTGPVLVEPLAAARGALLLAEIEDVAGNSDVTGAAPVVTRNDGNDGNDNADTDAIPVVSAPPSLAFSQALPVAAPIFAPFDGQGALPDAALSGAPHEPEPIPAGKPRSEKSRTIATIVAGAAAGAVIVFGIAALSGMFATDSPTTPTVSDAGAVEITTDVRPPTVPIADVPAEIVPDEPAARQYVPPAPVPAPVEVTSELPPAPPAPTPEPPPVTETTETVAPTETTTEPETPETTPDETETTPPTESTEDIPDAE